ncbi:hypothetical protein MTR67_029319 [Solanum verrucosum]|uniref:Uncharacterized protein n=1 Tax=Solanum verrucosum TaxID=315347 RepID=A0AAF0TXI2_SOLVR|nr:hypothetical protein MTR67_029319 [Solanum verrucosum]
MEKSSKKKQVGSADVSASTGIFSSIFPPPSKVMGRKASAAELMQSLEKQSSGCRAWNKSATAYVTKNKQGAGHCRSSKEHESLFQDRGETCPLSSSLLYGGQEDMYIKSSDAHKTLSYPSYKKEGGEYDSSGSNQYSASRGNWWQGMHVVIILQWVTLLLETWPPIPQDVNSHLFSRGVLEVLEPGCYRFVEDY